MAVKVKNGDWIEFNLAEALPEEMNRVKELIKEYDKIPTGVFGATVMKDLITKAEKATLEVDTVAMLRCYEALKNCE